MYVSSIVSFSLEGRKNPVQWFINGFRLSSIELKRFVKVCCGISITLKWDVFYFSVLVFENVFYTVSITVLQYLKEISKLPVCIWKMRKNVPTVLILVLTRVEFTSEMLMCFAYRIFTFKPNYNFEFQLNFTLYGFWNLCGNT